MQVERLNGACCLRQPWKGSASPSCLTRLHLGSLRATARSFATVGSRPTAFWLRLCWKPRGFTQGASLPVLFDFSTG